nr:hypothetical protein GCM10020063_038380 [Dactylosporangium thailandense]
MPRYAVTTRWHSTQDPPNIEPDERMPHTSVTAVASARPTTAKISDIRASSVAVDVRSASITADDEASLAGSDGPGDLSRNCKPALPQQIAKAASNSNGTIRSATMRGEPRFDIGITELSNPKETRRCPSRIDLAATATAGEPGAFRKQPGRPLAAAARAGAW